LNRIRVVSCIELIMNNNTRLVRHLINKRIKIMDIQGPYLGTIPNYREGHSRCILLDIAAFGS